MPKVFDRNMFIMLFSIMIGIVIITYFFADIMRRSQIEEIEQEHIKEIETIEKKNINFSSTFLHSIISINLAKDFRMDGEINYQLAYAFYKNVLSEKNETRFKNFKDYTIKNCTEALSNFKNSFLNFNDSVNNFKKVKNYTNYDIYLDLADIYVNYSQSGLKLTNLRYKMSNYLLQIAQNLTFVNGTIGYLQNTSNLLELLNNTMDQYLLELAIYLGLLDLLELYELYEPER